MIRAIVFDLGGVYFTDGFKSAITKFHRKFGIPTKKLKDELTKGIGKQYCTGRITRQRFWQEFMSKFNMDYNYEKLDDLWNASYYQNSELRSIVRQLRRKYTVGILSSTSRHRLNYLNDKFNFYKDFNYRQFSCITKLTKADPRTYKLLIRKLKLKPNEILYIDDESEHLRPARKAGIKTVQFRNNLALLRELRKHKLIDE